MHLCKGFIYSILSGEVLQRALRYIASAPAGSKPNVQRWTNKRRIKMKLCSFACSFACDNAELISGIANRTGLEYHLPMHWSSQPKFTLWVCRTEAQQAFDRSEARNSSPVRLVIPKTLRYTWLSTQLWEFYMCRYAQTCII